MSVSRKMRRRAGAERRATAAERRGATLITVCITLTVLLGMVGVGVDFARAWAFRTQLKTVTDAAAMAGVVEIVRKHPAIMPMSPEDTALAYVLANRINGQQQATAVDGDVEAVQWNFTTRTVQANFGNDYTSASVNGVRVRARYNMPTTFGRVFGINSIPITETTVAAQGGVGAQSCLKPWAVSYQTVINAYYAAKGQPVPSPAPTSLTNAQLDELAGMETPVTLLRGNDDPVTPGNIAQVQVWSDSFSTDIATDVTGSPYGQAIKSQYCTDRTVSIGDWIPTDPGQGAGQTAGPVGDLCGVQGNPATFSCDKEVKLIMWDIHNGLSGNNLTYRVADIAIFNVTQFDRGNGAATPDQVTGFFTRRSESGAFSGGPCEKFTCKVAIVQ